MRLKIQFLTPFSKTLHEPLTFLWCVLCVTSIFARFQQNGLRLRECPTSNIHHPTLNKYNDNYI